MKVTTLLAAIAILVASRDASFADPDGGALSCFNHATRDCCQIRSMVPMGEECPPNPPYIQVCDGYPGPEAMVSGPVLTTNGFQSLADYYTHYSPLPDKSCVVFDASCPWNETSGIYDCIYTMRSSPCNDYGLSTPSGNPILSYNCP